MVLAACFARLLPNYVSFNCSTSSRFNVIEKSVGVANILKKFLSCFPFFAPVLVYRRRNRRGYGAMAPLLFEVVAGMSNGQWVSRFSFFRYINMWFLVILVCLGLH